VQLTSHHFTYSSPDQPEDVQRRSAKKEILCKLARSRVASPHLAGMALPILLL